MLKAHPHIVLYSLHDFPDYKPPPEDGETFLENASIKALHASKALGKSVLADDSGLVVPALKGAPGVFSARFSREGATDAGNRKKLLEEMQSFDGEMRSAYFECCLVLANKEKVLKSVTGTCEGSLLKEERGGQGCGYDSLFLKEGYNQTFSEIQEDLKNRVSHRRKALDKMMLFLEMLHTHSG